MSREVELSTLNPRYEGHRLRDDVRETRLLASIASRGIEEPLEGVDTAEGRLLLDGFKRYRCARKLAIPCVPYVSLGDEETTGIVHLMLVGRVKTLGILEQARFIGDLLTIHGLSLAEVAGPGPGQVSLAGLEDSGLPCPGPSVDRQSVKSFGTLSRKDQGTP